MSPFGISPSSSWMMHMESIHVNSFPRSCVIWIASWKVRGKEDQGISVVVRLYVSWVVRQSCCFYFQYAPSSSLSVVVLPHQLRTSSEARNTQRGHSLEAINTSTPWYHPSNALHLEESTMICPNVLLSISPQLFPASPIPISSPNLHRLLPRAPHIRRRLRHR